MNAKEPDISLTMIRQAFSMVGRHVQFSAAICFGSARSQIGVFDLRKSQAPESMT
jgi:hypothetical protein